MRDARHVGGVRSSMCFGRERSSWSCKSRAGDRRHPLGGRAAPRAVGDKVHGPRKLHLRHQRVARASLYQYTRALSGEENSLSNTQAYGYSTKEYLTCCFEQFTPELDECGVWKTFVELRFVSNAHPRCHSTHMVCQNIGIRFVVALAWFSGDRDQCRESTSIRDAELANENRPGACRSCCK